MVYSVRELAGLAGMSKQATARLLESNGVRFARTGTKRLVYLSDLEAAMPELTDSIRFRGGNDD